MFRPIGKDILIIGWRQDSNPHEGNPHRVFGTVRVPEGPLSKKHYVFWNPNTKGRYKNLYKYWYTARKEAGMPWFQIKDFRRHFGITLSEGGAEMHVIQAMLGHSSVATTEKYYAHFSPDFAAKRALTVLEGGRIKGGQPSKGNLRVVGESVSESAN